jgi:putative transposase
MRDYRRSAHTIYALHYHFVFITKYRKPVLRGDIGAEVRDLVREVCRTLDIEIMQGHVRPDHVHLLLSVPPHLARLAFRVDFVEHESLAFRRR